MKKLSLLLALALALTVGTAALADTVTMDGTVAASDTFEVYAPIGGTVARVSAEVGQEVGADDVLATLKTTKVYAEEAGKITGVFGQPGDAADTVAARYGAVMYIEGEAAFTVSASTETAYNNASTKYVHVGEKVYLECRSNKSRSGEGTITGVEGTSYTVEVSKGSFIPGDSVDIFRDSGRTNTQKVGRGTVARRNPTAVKGSGSIVRIHVQDGDTVQRGDVLFETLDGSFDGFYMSGENLVAGESGIVESLKVEQGGTVQKGGMVAVLYKRENMRVEAQVPEDSLGDIAVGDRVIIELEADESKTFVGEVTMISGIATASQGDGEVTYRVLVAFTPDATVRYGMSVVVTTAEEESGYDSIEEEEPAAEQAEESAETAESAETQPAERTGRGSREGGFPNGERPTGERPEGGDFPDLLSGGDGN